MEYTTTEQRDTFAVLADLAQALEDAERRPRLGRNPTAEVDGFELLPVELQETVKAMSVDEMAAVGRMHAALLANGFSVQNGSDGTEAGGGGVRRLSMF